MRKCEEEWGRWGDERKSGGEEKSGESGRVGEESYSMFPLLPKVPHSMVYSKWRAVSLVMYRK